MTERLAVPVEGATLRCEVEGQGEPAIVLHGGPGVGFDYLRRDLARVLARRYRLVFYDPRGSGRSTGAEAPGDLALSRFVLDLDAVRAFARIERPVLLAHSFGGLLALHYALTFPGRLSSLVLIDSDPATFDEWSRFKTVVEERRTPEERRRLAEITSRPGWWSDPAAVEDQLRTHFACYFADRALADRLSFGLDERALAGFWATGRRVRDDLGAWDLRARLRSVACPTVVIHCAKGVFRREALLELHAGIAGSRLVVLESSGHFPFIEDPEGLACACG